VLELSHGRYQEALASAPSAFEQNLFVSAFALPDFIEAAIRSGEASVAERALAMQADRCALGGSAMALGLLARSRALIATDDEAEHLYKESIELLSPCRGVSHIARTRLLYGEWLRRRKRRADAREQLQLAHAAFEVTGAAAFEERTRLELQATGQTARKRVDETRYDLTPQEARIAMLASRGATNQEIAAKLFISPRTVDYHLRKVFRKLDVPSRRDLVRMSADHAW
jgi:DNA-binding CsgD family transcriptional regulator